MCLITGMVAQKYVNLSSMNDSKDNNNPFNKPVSRRVLLGGAATAAVVLLKSSQGQTIQTAITGLSPRMKLMLL